MKRREFLKRTCLMVGSLCLSRKCTGLATFPEVILAHTANATAALKAALNELGGIERFINPGDTVIIKPDMAWDRKPDLNASTSPDLVVETIKQCKQAGAKTIQILGQLPSQPLNTPARDRIEIKAEANGAEVILFTAEDFVETNLSKGKRLQKCSIVREYLTADKVISIPLAKRHGVDRVSLSVRNLQTLIAPQNGLLYSDYPDNILNVIAHILPALTIIDATNLVSRSTTRRQQSKHKLKDTIIVSPCAISADICALPLLGYRLEEVQQLKVAVDRGMNRFPVAHLKVKTISL